MTAIFQKVLDEWTGLTSGLRFPAYDPASPELRDAIAAHNANVAGLNDRLATAGRAVQEALAKVEVGEYCDLFAALDRREIDRGALIQGVAELWKSREQLAEMAETEFGDALAPTQAEADKVITKVKADYERMGSGLAAMPAHSTNGEAAEQQLDFLARYRNTRAQKALAAVQDARARLDAATEQKRFSQEGRERTHKFVTRVVRKLAGV
jgi:hypothetical protein